MFDLALHEAVKNKDIELLKNLIESGNDINAKNSWHCTTPLHLAVDTNVEIIELLLKHGADINAKDFKGRTPLSLAIKKSIMIISKLLIEQGADINVQDNEGNTSLHFVCCMKSNFKMTKFLLQHGADPNVKNHVGERPLHFAVENSIEHVKVLIENGADANAKDNLGITIFSRACGIAGNIKIVKHLYQINANTTRRDPALLSNVSIENNPDILKFLIEIGVHFSDNMNLELNLSIMYGNVENVKILLDNGASINFNSDRIDLFYRQIYKIPRIFKAINIIRKHLIKLKMFNLVDKDIFKKWRFTSKTQTDEFTNFEEECKKEAEKLRKIICSKRNIQFSDILTKNSRAVAVYLNIDRIKQKLEKVVWKQNYPIYASLMKSKIRKCNKLAELLTPGYKSLQAVLGDVRIPHTVLSEIITLLKEKDLKILNSVVT